jgi:riboflavin kinase
MKHRMLLYIGGRAGFFDKLKTSTTKISKDMKVSQQSVSRILINLEEEEYIRRDISNKGIILSLKDKGRKYLENEFNFLQKVIKEKNSITGKIFKGFGEGAYYIKRYSKKLKDKLGYEPYPGTLNVKVKEKELKEFLHNENIEYIEEFKGEEREFGKVSIVKVIIEGVDGAIIFPERSKHKDNIIELIGPTCFRTGFNLTEGDKVNIHKIEEI